MSTIPAAYRMLASRILEDAVEHGVLFGDRKVFLGTIPCIDLGDAECCCILADLLRSGALQFARADLVAAMDPELVASSEWRLGDRCDSASYHFLVLPDCDWAACPGYGKPLSRGCRHACEMQ